MRPERRNFLRLAVANPEIGAYERQFLNDIWTGAEPTQQLNKLKLGIRLWLRPDLNVFEPLAHIYQFEPTPAEP